MLPVPGTASSILLDYSDDALRFKGAYLLVAVAHFRQHLVGVLADLGQGAAHRRGCARESRRLVNDAQAPETRMVHLGGGADVLYLRVGEHLVHRIDGPARHAGLVEGLDPMSAR